MAVVLAAAAALLVVFVIAAAVLGREARRLDAQVRRPVFDLDEAVTFVADRLPFEVAAVLSYDDVRRIIAWHVEYLRTRAAMANGHGPRLDGPIVVAGAEAVDYVLARSRGDAAGYTPAQVHAVLEAQMAYLASIEAVVPVEPPEADAGGPAGG